MADPMPESKQEGASGKKEKFSRSRSKSRKRSRKGQETDGKKSASKESAQPVKRKRCLPLNGMVVSVSTLIGAADKDTDAEISYNNVTLSCKELGADVKGQVCKSVQVLVCTLSAVKKATQRIRKAFKKGIPIVEVGWLEKCRLEQKRVDFETFRLDKEAEDAINNRQETIDKEKPAEEVPPDAGWSEAVTLGCCCVCHENGTEKECKWCVAASDCDRRK
jgi:hypothetical protein